MLSAVFCWDVCFYVSSTYKVCIFICHNPNSSASCQTFSLFFYLFCILFVSFVFVSVASCSKVIIFNSYILVLILSNDNYNNRILNSCTFSLQNPTSPRNPIMWVWCIVLSEVCLWKGTLYYVIGYFHNSVMSKTI